MTDNMTSNDWLAKRNEWILVREGFRCDIAHKEAEISKITYQILECEIEMEKAEKNEENLKRDNPFDLDTHTVSYNGPEKAE